MKIGWPQISKKRYGGSIHDEMVRKVLAKETNKKI